MTHKIISNESCISAISAIEDGFCIGPICACNNLTKKFITVKCMLCTL